MLPEGSVAASQPRLLVFGVGAQFQRKGTWSSEVYLDEGVYRSASGSTLYWGRRT